MGCSDSKEKDDGPVYLTQPEPYSVSLACAVAQDDLEKVKELIANGASPHGRLGHAATTREDENKQTQPQQEGDQRKQGETTPGAQEGEAQGQEPQNGGTTPAQQPAEGEAAGEEEEATTKQQEEEKKASQDMIDTTGAHEGMSIIHIAASHNSVQVLRYLLGTDGGFKIHPNLPDATETGSTPLHHAALGGATETARALVKEFGCDPDVEDAKGSPPIHYAAYNDSADFVRVMVKELKADVDFAGEGGQPPVFSATQGGATATFLVLANELNASLHTKMRQEEPEGEEPEQTTDVAQAEPDAPPHEEATGQQAGDTPTGDAEQEPAQGENQQQEAQPQEQQQQQEAQPQEQQQQQQAQPQEQQQQQQQDQKKEKKFKEVDLMTFAEESLHEEEESLILNFLRHPVQSAIKRDDSAWLEVLVQRHEATVGPAPELDPTTPDDPPPANTEHEEKVLAARREFVEGHIGFGPNENKEGLELLHFAAKYNAEKCCRALGGTYQVDTVSMGWGPEGSPITKSTPLHVAASVNAVKAVQVLVQEGGVNPNVPDQHGSPPIHWAAFADHVDIVSGLVQNYGVDPTQPWGTQGHTVLFSAVQGDAINVFNYLTGSPDGVSPARVPVVNTVTAEDGTSVSQAALFTFDGVEQSIGQWAVQYKAWEIVLALGGEAPPVGERMEAALRADDVDTVKKWYHNKYDEGRDPTGYLFTGDSDALEKGLLHLAAECNAIRTLRYLLSEYRSGTQQLEVKMDPHQPDASDSACTPLHHAALEASQEVASCLVLQHKCDPNVQDGHGSPPLHYAAYNDCSDFVRMMVKELHADVNVGGTAGYQPPIFSAAQGNAVATVRVMVEELGCNPESTMEMYDHETGATLESVQTLMECAVEYEAHDVVKYLQDPSSFRVEQKKQQEDLPSIEAEKHQSEMLAPASTTAPPAEEEEQVHDAPPEEEEDEGPCRGVDEDTYEQEEEAEPSPPQNTDGPTATTGGNDAKAGEVEEEEEEDEWVHDEESGYMYGSKCGLYFDEESGCYYDPDADVWMDEDGETVPG